MNFIKGSTTYEVTVNENKYQFVIPMNAPIGETYDVVFKFLSIIADQAKMASDALKREQELKTGTPASEIIETKN